MSTLEEAVLNISKDSDDKLSNEFKELKYFIQTGYQRILDIESYIKATENDPAVEVEDVFNNEPTFEESLKRVGFELANNPELYEAWESALIGVFFVNFESEMGGVTDKMNSAIMKASRRFLNRLIRDINNDQE